MSFSSDPISENGKSLSSNEHTLFMLDVKHALGDLSKNVDRLILSIEGNGKPGLKDRVFTLERDVNDCKNNDVTLTTAVSTVSTELKKLEEKTTSWQLKVFQALIYIAAGSGTTAAVFKMLTGGQQ